MGALAATAVLALSGCTSGGDGGGGGEPDEGGAATSEQADAPPAIVEQDGFHRSNTLPDPLAEQIVTLPTENGTGSAKLQIVSLDSDGESVRLIGAWLQPVDGEGLASDTLTSSAESVGLRPWVRLIDRESGTLIEPLQHDGGSGNFDPGTPANVTDAGPATDTVHKTQCVCSGVANSTPSDPSSDPTELFYLDFPAPTGGEVDVLAGESLQPLADVPVSQGQAMTYDEELTNVTISSSIAQEFPWDYGAGATVARTVPLTSKEETVGGSFVEKDQEITRVNLPADVLFDFDSDELTDEAQDILDDSAEQLQEDAAGKTVTVEGHTDDEGEDAYNQDLSERRAAAVEEEMAGRLEGSAITLETEGFGETRPAFPNRDSQNQAIEANQEKNRRVSFSFESVDDVDAAVDAGRELPDIPDMEDAATPNPDAIAEGVMTGTGDGDDSEIQVSVTAFERFDDGIRLEAQVSTASGSYEADALSVLRPAAGEQYFGPNPYAGASEYPSAAGFSLLDEDAQTLLSPTTAASTDCLCAQGSPIGTDLSGEPLTLWAHYPDTEFSGDEVVLRISDTAQLRLPVPDDAQSGDAASDGAQPGDAQSDDAQPSDAQG